MFNPLYGRFGAWVRQPADTSEGTYSAIIESMQRYMAGDVLCPKVADGKFWQVANDPSAIPHARGLRQLADWAYERDVTIMPTVVPRGADWHAEGLFHAEIANVLGCIMVDIEPYAGFWDRGPLTDIVFYFRQLRNAAPDAYIVSQPDPRYYGWNDARVPQCMDYINGLAPQDYVGADWAQWYDVAALVQNMTRRITDYPNVDHYTTLYGSERIDLAGAYWSQVRELRKANGKPAVLGAHTFAYGGMNLNELTYWRDVARPIVQPISTTDPVEPPPPPPPPPPDDRFAVLEGEVRQWLADDVTHAHDRQNLREERINVIAEG